MKSFKLLPHTADIRLEVQGGSLEEVFRAALSGMSELMKHGYCQSDHSLPVSKELSLTATDSTGLLIDFLSEVLTRSNIEKAIFCDLKVLELTEKKLIGVITGFVESQWDEDIKAVTFHEARLIQNNNGQWSTTIIFDI